MHAAIKLIIGLIIIGVGVWLLVPHTWIAPIKPASLAAFDWGDEFITVLAGAVPPILIILGILVVWIESEELKSPELPEVEEEKTEEKKEEERE